MIAAGLRALVEQLHGLGYGSVPLCAGTAGGRCSARWHEQPCARIGKRPLVKGYPDLARDLPSATILWNRYFRHVGHLALNLGLVVPDGHVVVEADSNEADAELRVLLGESVTATRGARDQRGCAYIVRLPAGVTIASMRYLGHCQKIDTIGPGGILVVPPSRHHTGHEYTWLTPPPAIAYAPRALVALLGKAAEDRDMRVPEPRSTQTPPLASPSGRPHDDELPSREERLARAVGYIAKMPPAIQGEDGSDATFHVALALTRGFCLPAEDALDVMTASYNPRCLPRWQRGDLLHKITDASNADAVPWGYTLGIDPADPNRNPVLVAPQGEAGHGGGGAPRQGADPAPVLVAERGPHPTWLASSCDCSGTVSYVSMVIHRVDVGAERCTVRFAWEDAPKRTPRPCLVLDRPISDRAREHWEHLRRAVNRPNAVDPGGMAGCRLRVELIDQGGPAPRVGRVWPPIASPKKVTRRTP